MSEQATMFLNDLSVVDHAYVNYNGNVIGGSYNPSFLVTGKIDPVEKVVVDFSTVKKTLKQMIDHNETGFDHKCWIIEGMSRCAVKVDGEVVTDYTLLDSDHFSSTAVVQIITPSLNMTAPKNAFKFIPRLTNYENYCTESAGKWFERYLNELFAPDGIVVECNNNVHIHTYLDQEQHPAAYFTYVHGLKDSTSWGCQNLAHGHLSFIQLESDAGAHVEQSLALKIADDLNRTVFINKANVIEPAEPSETTTIRYTTPRGEFIGSYKDLPADGHKVRVLETETTVEFLISYIKATYADELKVAGIKALYVSEGLTKGAYITV